MSETALDVPPIEPREVRHHVDLSGAVLCLDCDAIYNQQQGNDCPRCGYSSAFPVTRVIAPLPRVWKEKE